jgi:hypothetical protein
MSNLPVLSFTEAPKSGGFHIWIDGGKIKGMRDEKEDWLY